MLIFNLADKSVAIPTSELPSIILDNPLVQLAWEIRRTAQRNFDIQKEGSKSNAEYGANMINLLVRLLRQPKVPYLLACLVEVRLREIRRSALRALTRTYPRLRAEPLRYNDQGEVIERRMLLIQTLDRILGCEEQDDEGSAYDDVDPVPKDPDHEAIDTVQKFQLEVYPDAAEAMGALINLGVAYNGELSSTDFECSLCNPDNRDAPYTRRWKMITDKRASLSFVDVVNGTAGVQVDGRAAPTAQTTPRRVVPPAVTAPTFFPTLTQPTPVVPEAPKPSAPAFSFGKLAVPVKEQVPIPSTVPTKTDLPFSFGPSTSTPTPTPPVVEPPKEAAKLPAFTFSTPQPLPPLPSQPPSKAFEAPIPSVDATAPPSKAPPTSEPVIPLAAPLLATPSTPPVTPSAKALGKRPAIPRPAPSPRISEHDRRRNRRAASPLKDEMIRDILRDTLSDMTVDLLKMVNQEDAARKYHAASDQRHMAIGTWSIWVYEAIRAQMIERIARKAVLKELKKRYLSRKYAALWKTWARRRKTQRRNLVRDRKQVFADFGRMGLGGGDMILSEGLGEGSAGRAGSEIRDEFLADVSLRESASERAHLFASTTFLHIIARHVAPLLAAPPFDPLTSLSSPLSSISRKTNALYEWETVLSLAQDAGSAPPSEASDWLRSKLLPKDESFYEYSDVLLGTSIIGRYDDDVPDVHAVGLVIFEAPLKADHGGTDAEDIADAQDRLLGLSRMSQDQTNRYDPVLLILTWQPETMEELAARLDIQSDLDLFPRRAVMCLSSLDEVDSTLESTLRTLLPAIMPKRQVIIKLRELLGRLLPIWQRYIDTIRLLLRNGPTDAQLALSTFQSGIECINEVSSVALKSLGPVRINEFTPFIPITIPQFEASSISSLQDAAQSIADYLSADELSGLDETDLLLGPLTRAAISGAALPIPEILSSLASLVFGELSNQIMPLDSYWPPAIADEVVKGYMVTATGSYEKSITSRLEALGRSSPPQQIPQRQAKDGFTSPTTLKTGSKRGRISSSENLRVSPAAKQIKAAKNARLLDVMADVKRTLGEMNVDAVY